MKILSIGDEVRGGTYRLHSCFRRAINFTDGRRLVTLVTPDIGAGPVNIVLRGRTPLRDLSDASDTSDHLLHPFLQVGRYSVVFANRRFLLNEAQSYGSLLHIEKETSREVFRKNLKIVEDILTKESHPKSLAFLLDAKRERNFHTAFDRAFVAQIKDGASRMFPVAGVGDPGSPRSPAFAVRLRRGKATAATKAGIRLLAGCGFGLTPSGDDFIAGMLIGLNILQRVTGRSNRRLVQAIYSAVKGNNLLSNSFLRLARDGRVSENMQKFISALFYHGDTEVKGKTEEVMAAGETSGADLLTGLVMTVKNGVLESRSVGVLEKRQDCSSHHSMTPVLHYSMAPGDIP